MTYGFTRVYSPWRLALVSGAIACIVARAAISAVDVNRANDYYANKGSNAVNVVELYHMSPCEKQLGERAYARAMAECGFILKIFPNHPTALLLTAQICEEWKSPTCMLDDVFGTAIAINPKAPGTYVVEGIHLHRTGRYEQAIQKFQKALELDANEMNAHYDIALTYLETKQFDLANTHAQRAYALGATLPGLRERLTKAGYWKPTPQNAAPTPEAKAPGSGRPAAPGESTGTR